MRSYSTAGLRELDVRSTMANILLLNFEFFLTFLLVSDLVRSSKTAPNDPYRNETDVERNTALHGNKSFPFVTYCRKRLCRDHERCVYHVTMDRNRAECSSRCNEFIKYGWCGKDGICVLNDKSVPFCRCENDDHLNISVGAGIYIPRCISKYSILILVAILVVTVLLLPATVMLICTTRRRCSRNRLTGAFLQMWPLRSLEVDYRRVASVREDENTQL